MRYIPMIPAALLGATPALAHPGPHLQPHGIGAGALLLAASLVAGGVGAVLIRVRK